MHGPLGNKKNRPNHIWGIHCSSVSGFHLLNRYNEPLRILLHYHMLNDARGKKKQQNKGDDQRDAET